MYFTHGLGLQGGYVLFVPISAVVRAPSAAKLYPHDKSERFLLLLKQVHYLGTYTGGLQGLCCAGSAQREAGP